MEVNEDTLALLVGRQMLQILILREENEVLRRTIDYMGTNKESHQENDEGWPPLGETPNHHPTPMPE